MYLIQCQITQRGSTELVIELVPFYKVEQNVKTTTRTKFNACRYVK